MKITYTGGTRMGGVLLDNGPIRSMPECASGEPLGVRSDATLRLVQGTDTFMLRIYS